MHPTIVQEAFGTLPAARINVLSIYLEMANFERDRDATAILGMVGTYKKSHPFVDYSLRVIHRLMSLDTSRQAAAETMTIVGHRRSIGILRSAMAAHRDDPSIMLHGAWIIVSLAVTSKVKSRVRTGNALVFRRSVVVHMPILRALATCNGFILIRRALILNAANDHVMVSQVTKRYMSMKAAMTIEFF